MDGEDRSTNHRQRFARRRRDELRQTHGERALAVLDVLIAHDPAKLVAMGAPAEQYTTEAGPLAERLGALDAEDEVAAATTAVLDVYFGTSWTADIEQLAADVWAAWNVPHGS